jgi:nicotinamidase/pyrazinamidase
MMNRRNLLASSAGSLVLCLIGSRVAAASKFPVGESDVFVVVEVQNCFVPGGSLAGKSAGVQRIQSSDLL